MENGVSEIVREEFECVFDSLGVEVQDEDIEQAYSIDVQHWNDIDDKYKVACDKKEDTFDGDFLLARELLLKSLDKSDKIMDEVFSQIAVKTTPVMLQIGQEATRNIQNGVKALTDLHNAYQTVKQKELRNQKELNPDEEDKDKGKMKDAEGNELEFEEK